MILDRDREGLGAARLGELRVVAERVGRSISAVRAMLHKLRRCRAAVLGSGEKDGSRPRVQALPGTL
jgi:hypothetical protein